LTIPSPNRKDACTYGIKLLGTLNYGRREIQSKVFGGANCISTLYRLLNNWASNPGQVVSHTWQYQVQIEKMLAPMVFSY
jgi:hypothetical protein